MSPDPLQVSVFHKEESHKRTAGTGYIWVAILDPGILAALGLYSVMAYTVNQRTHEIGILMALGAKPRNVLSMVVRQGIPMTLAGVLVGIAAALIVTRLVTSLLVNVSATDPIIFSAAALFLALVALLGSYLPARHATRVDPIVALRWE